MLYTFVLLSKFCKIIENKFLNSNKILRWKVRLTYFWTHVVIVTSVFKLSCIIDFIYVHRVLPTVNISVHFQFRWILKENKAIWDRS